jgi:hypothetical protein
MEKQPAYRSKNDPVRPQARLPKSQLIPPAVGRLTLTYAAARNCSVIHSVPNGAQAVGAVVSRLVAVSGGRSSTSPLDPYTAFGISA